MKKVSDFLKSNFKRFFLIASILLLAALVAFQGFSDNPYSFKNNGSIEDYNEVMDDIKNGDVTFEEVVDNLGTIEKLSEPDSFAKAVSKYNLAYLVTIQGETDIETLRVATELLRDALRIRPDDVDIRKNLELVTNILIEQVAQQLQASGMSGEEAEEAAKSQELGDIPSDGLEPGRNHRDGQDY